MTPIHEQALELLDQIIADMRQRGRPWAPIDTLEAAKGVIRRDTEEQRT